MFAVFRGFLLGICLIHSVILRQFFTLILRACSYFLLCICACTFQHISAKLVHISANALHLFISSEEAIILSFSKSFSVKTAKRSQAHGLSVLVENLAPKGKNLPGFNINHWLA